MVHLENLTTLTKIQGTCHIPALLSPWTPSASAYFGHTTPESIMA